MRPGRLLVVASLLLVLGCGSSKGRLDGRTAAIFSGATKVEVFRIDGGKDSPDPTPTKPGDPTVGGYAILARGADQGPDFARELADVLDDGKTYTDQFAKCFWPGVAFRVWKDDECVDLIVCFYCHNFYLGPRTDHQVMETASFSGSSNAARLVRLAKEAFPDDKEVQALEEK
jgi:hypothetical protein